MNTSKLRNSISQRVRLRPFAMSVLAGRVIAQRDDVWIIQAVHPGGIVELGNLVTTHVAQLGSDHIHHYDSDPPSDIGESKNGFLILTVQVFMSGSRLWIEPLSSMERRRLASASS